MPSPGHGIVGEISSWDISGSSGYGSPINMSLKRNHYEKEFFIEPNPQFSGDNVIQLSFQGDDKVFFFCNPCVLLASMFEVIEVLKNAGAEDGSPMQGVVVEVEGSLNKRYTLLPGVRMEVIHYLVVVRKLVYTPFRRLRFYYPDIR